MKKVSVILVLAMLSLIGQQLFAQCENTKGTMTPGVTTIGQSFIGCSSQEGNFKEITIKLSHLVTQNSNGKLKIFKGEPSNPSTQLAQYVQDVSIAGNTSNAPKSVSFTLNGGLGSLAYEPGEKYTFIIELTRQIKPLADYNNAYPGGRAFANFTPNPKWDFVFAVKIEDKPAASRKLKVLRAAGKGSALFANGDAKIVAESAISSNDMWVIEQVGNNKVLKCVGKGYLKMKAPINSSLYELNFTSSTSAALKFNIETTDNCPKHQINFNGVSSPADYKVFASLDHSDFALGVWNDKVVLKKNAPDCNHNGESTVWILLP